MAIIKPNNNTISAITALPAAISTGKVLQIQNTTATTQKTTTSSSSFVEAYTVDITPSATSSKILILFSTFGQHIRSASKIHLAKLRATI